MVDSQTDMLAAALRGTSPPSASRRYLTAEALPADMMAEPIGGSGKVAPVVHDQTSRSGITPLSFVSQIAAEHPGIEIVAIHYGLCYQLRSTEITTAIQTARCPRVERMRAVPTRRFWLRTTRLAPSPRRPVRASALWTRRAGWV